MTLDDAIELLCRVHLRHPTSTFWHVEVGAIPTGYDAALYPEAWDVLRCRLLASRTPVPRHYDMEAQRSRERARAVRSLPYGTPDV